jgi:hypothetical protein
VYVKSFRLNINNKGNKDKIYMHKLRLVAISTFLELILNFLMKVHRSWLLYHRYYSLFWLLKLILYPSMLKEGPDLMDVLELCQSRETGCKISYHILIQHTWDHLCFLLLLKSSEFAHYIKIII